MKKQIFCALISLLALLISANAQTPNVWKGGFPGRENDWHCFKNWSLGKTPDVFDNVIIPDVSTTTRHYPVVFAGQIEVQSLEIQSGAVLTLSRSARILTDNFSSTGTCKGCEWRVLIEGAEPPATASTGLKF